MAFLRQTLRQSQAKTRKARFSRETGALYKRSSAGASLLNRWQGAQEQRDKLVHIPVGANRPLLLLQGRYFDLLITNTSRKDGYNKKSVRNTDGIRRNDAIQKIISRHPIQITGLSVTAARTCK